MPASHPPAAPPAARRGCRCCGAVLDPLRARLHEVCSRPACLQQRDREREQQWRRQLGGRLKSAQSRALGGERADALRVVWLSPWETRLVELPPQLAEEQRAHLRALAASEGAAGTAPAPAAAEAATPQRAEGQLCGWCGGRCCRYGGESHAYLELPHLRRWQLDHPGSSLADAAEAYAARLPAQHVAGSCMYHGAQGCTLDRSMRSDVCNRFACDGLREVQTVAGAAPHTEWLLAMHQHGRVSRLAVATRDGVTPAAPPEPDADDLR